MVEEQQLMQQIDTIVPKKNEIQVQDEIYLFCYCYLLLHCMCSFYFQLFEGQNDFW